MPSTKYQPLAAHLLKSGEAELPMIFSDIEKIIGAKLPASAFKHRAWWSNNPTNSVMTRAWLEAGYISAEVDMTGHKLVFRKSGPDGSPPGMDGTDPPHDDSGPPVAPGKSIFARIYGALRGTVTIRPGTDLTAPVDADWDATR